MLRPSGLPVDDEWRAVRGISRRRGETSFARIGCLGRAGALQIPSPAGVPGAGDFRGLARGWHFAHGRETRAGWLQDASPVPTPWPRATAAQTPVRPR